MHANFLKAVCFPLIIGIFFFIFWNPGDIWEELGRTVGEEEIGGARLGGGSGGTSPGGARWWGLTCCMWRCAWAHLRASTCCPQRPFRFGEAVTTLRTSWFCLVWAFLARILGALWTSSLPSLKASSCFEACPHLFFFQCLLLNQVLSFWLFEKDTLVRTWCGVATNSKRASVYLWDTFHPASPKSS